MRLINLYNGGLYCIVLSCIFAKLLTLRPDMFLNVKEFNRVDFPAPDAPMIANICPGRTYPLTNGLIIYYSLEISDF